MDTKKLRQKILDLAIHGKLVPQDPNDEPASVLLERIKAEKERLIKEGKIKKSKKSVKTSDTPHYENVPFEVPEGWVWTTLEEILELVSGQDFPPEKYNVSISGIPYIIGASNIENEQLAINRWTKFPSVYSYLNDLLVVCKGAGVGKMAINNIGTVHIARQIQAVRAYAKCINIRYIKAVIKNNIENIISKANGLIPGLKRELLLSLQIPLPPFAEQQRIVIEIEKLFALIDQIEQSKADLQTIIKQTKSKILDLAIHGKLVPQDPNDEPAIELLKRINPGFTPCDNGHYTFKIPNSWTWCKLGDIAQSNIGLTYKPTDITDNGIPVYRSNNIRDRKIDKSDLVRVNAPILEKQFLNIGDLLICARNGSRRLVGKCAIIEELDEVTSFGAFMAVCRSEYNQWIFNLLNTTYFDRYLDDSNSTAINQVTQRMLLALHIPLPPLSEQQRIVQKIEELFSVLDNIQNALEV